MSVTPSCSDSLGASVAVPLYERLQCSDCPKLFRNLKSLKQHQKNICGKELRTNKYPKPCELCNKICNTSKYYHNHKSWCAKSKKNTVDENDENNCKIYFHSLDDFYLWKTREQALSRTYFSKHCGSQVNKDGNVRVYYYCVIIMLHKSYIVKQGSRQELLLGKIRRG